MIHRPLLEDDMQSDIEGDEDCDDNDDLENDGVYFDSDEVVHFTCTCTLGFKCRNKVTIGNIGIPRAYFLCKYI